MRAGTTASRKRERAEKSPVAHAPGWLCKESEGGGCQNGSREGCARAPDRWRIGELAGEVSAAARQTGVCGDERVRQISQLAWRTRSPGVLNSTTQVTFPNYFTKHS